MYDPRSKGAESYIRLAKEIIAHHLPAEQAEPAAEETSEQAKTAEELDKTA